MAEVYRYNTIQEQDSEKSESGSFLEQDSGESESGSFLTFDNFDKLPISEEEWSNPKEVRKKILESLELDMDALEDKFCELGGSKDVLQNEIYDASEEFALEAVGIDQSVRDNPKDDETFTVANRQWAQVSKDKNQKIGAIYHPDGTTEVMCLFSKKVEQNIAFMKARAGDLKGMMDNRENDLGHFPNILRWNEQIKVSYQSPTPTSQ